MFFRKSRLIEKLKKENSMLKRNSQYSFKMLKEEKEKSSVIIKRLSNIQFKCEFIDQNADFNKRYQTFCAAIKIDTMQYVRMMDGLLPSHKEYYIERLLYDMKNMLMNVRFI